MINEPKSPALDPTADPATQEPRERWTYLQTVMKARDLGLEDFGLDAYELDLKPLKQNERGIIATAVEATQAPEMFRSLFTTEEDRQLIESRLGGVHQILGITEKLLRNGSDPRVIRAQLDKQFSMETDRAFGARLDEMMGETDGRYAQAFSGYGDLMQDWISALPEKDVLDAVADYDYETLIPVWGMIQDVRSDIELYGLLKKSADGKTTLEEDERITKYLIDTYRPKTTAAQVYDGVMTSLQFVGDMFVGGLGARGIRAGLKAGFGAAMKKLGADVTEAGVRNSIMRSMQAGMLGHLRNAASGTGFVARAAQATEGVGTLAARTAGEGLALAEQYTVNVGASMLLSSATGAADEIPIKGLADRINVEEALANAAIITGFGDDPMKPQWESLATQPLEQTDWPDHIKALIEYASERVSNILFPGQGNVLKQYGAAAQSYPLGRTIFPGISPADWAAMVARNDLRNLVPVAPFGVKGTLVELFEEQAARFMEVGAGKAGWLTGEEETGSWEDAFPTIDEWIVEALTVAGTMGGTQLARKGAGAAGKVVRPLVEDPGMRRRREAAERLDGTDRAAAATTEELQQFAQSYDLREGEMPEGAETVVQALGNMGIDLRFYSPGERTPENEAKAGGFYNRQVRGTIFINSDTFGTEEEGGAVSQALGELAYHEGWHSVSDVLGEDWRTMVGAAESTQEWQDAGAQYDAEAEAAGLPVRADLQDDVAADEAAATIAQRNWRTLFGATQGAKRSEVRKAMRDLLGRDGNLLERVWRKTRQMLQMDVQASGLQRLQEAGLMGGVDNPADAVDRATAVDSLLEAMDVAAIVRGRKQSAEARELITDAVDAPETQHLTQPLREALDESLAELAAEPAAPQEPVEPAVEGEPQAPSVQRPQAADVDVEQEAVRLTMETALRMRNQAEALRQELEAAPATMPRQKRQQLKKEIRALERESDKLLGDLEGELQGLPLDELQARVEAQQPSPFRGSTPLSRELVEGAPVRLRQRNSNYTRKIGETQQSDPWVIENVYDIEGVQYASIGNAALNRRLAVPLDDLVSAQEGVELQGPASMPIAPGSMVRNAVDAAEGEEAFIPIRGPGAPDAVRVVDVTGPEGAQRARLETGDVVAVDRLTPVEGVADPTLGDQERIGQAAQDALRGQSRFARPRLSGVVSGPQTPEPGRQPSNIIGMPGPLDANADPTIAGAFKGSPSMRTRSQFDSDVGRALSADVIQKRGKSPDAMAQADMLRQQFVAPPPVLTPWEDIPLPKIMEEADSNSPLGAASRVLEASYRNGLFSEQQAIAYAFVLMSMPQDRIRDLVLQMRFDPNLATRGTAALSPLDVGGSTLGRLSINAGDVLTARQRGVQRQRYGTTFLHELGHLLTYDSYMGDLGQRSGPMVQTFARVRDLMLRDVDADTFMPVLAELFGVPMRQLDYFLQAPKAYENGVLSDFARGGELAAEMMGRAMEDRGRDLVTQLGLLPELGAVFQRGATLAEQAAMAARDELAFGQDQEAVGSILDISRALSTAFMGTQPEQTVARALLEAPRLTRVPESGARQAEARKLLEYLNDYDSERRRVLGLSDRMADQTDREVDAERSTPEGMQRLAKRREAIMADTAEQIGAGFDITDDLEARIDAGARKDVRERARAALRQRDEALDRLSSPFDVDQMDQRERDVTAAVADTITEEDVDNVRRFVEGIGQGQLDLRSRFAAPKSLPAPLQVTTNQAPVPDFKKLTQKFNDSNREANLTQLVNLERLIPNPLTSTRMWHKLVKTAFGDDFSVAPPRRLIDGVRNPETLREQLSNLDADQIMHANEGIELTDVLRRRYENGEMTPTDTADLFVWAFLSRMLSAAPHESAFLMAYENGLSRFTERIAQGQWTEADEQEWASWVKGWLPVLAEEDKKKLHGEWMSSAKTNLNAIGGSEGRDTSWAGNVANARVNGRPLMQVVHEALEDPNTTGSDVRRLFLSHAGQSGMGTKLTSFVMLIAGKRDVFVIDRWQARNMWPQFSEAKKPVDPYDGVVVPGQFNKKGKPVTAGVADILDGPSGLALYEGMERGMRSALDEAYQGTNRQPDVGRYHWESWLLVSSQAVGHASLRRFTGDGNIAGLGVIEGRQNRDTFEQAFVYLSDGTRGYVIEDTHGVPRFFTPDEYARRPKGKSKKAQQSAIEYVQSVGRILSSRDLDALSWIPGVARFRADNIEEREPSRLAPKPGQSELDATVEALKASGALSRDFSVDRDLISQFALPLGQSMTREEMLANEPEFQREQDAYFRALDNYARNLSQEQESQISASVSGILPPLIEAAESTRGIEDLNDQYGLQSARANMMIGGFAAPGLELSNNVVQLHLLGRMRQQLFAESDASADVERQRALRMMGLVIRAMESSAAQDVEREFQNQYRGAPPVIAPNTDTIAPMPNMRITRRVWAEVKDRYTRLADFERYVGLIDPRLANLPAERSPLRKAELSSGRESGLILNFNEQHLTPFVKAARGAGLDNRQVFSDFEDFLIARHAPEANAVLEQRAAQADALEAQADALADQLAGRVLESDDPNVLTATNVSFLTASEVKAMRDEIKRNRATARAIRPRLLYEVYETDQAKDLVKQLRQKYPEFAALARRIDGMVAQTRDLLLQTEVISQEQYDEWKKFKYYVPLRGWETDEGYSEPSPLNKRRGFSTWGPVALLRGGRDSRPDSPVVYVLNQAYEAIQRGVANEVGIAFYNIARQVPRQVLEVRRLRPGERYSRRNRDTHFRLNIKGVPHSIRLGDPELARSIASVGIDALPKFMKGFRFVTKTQARLNTTASPTFSVSNAFRDIEYAIAKSQVWKDSGLNIGVADVVKNIALVAPAVASMNMQQSPQGEMADLYRRAREAGAFTGWRQSVGLENVRRDLKAELERGSLSKVMNMMGIALELGSQTSEEAVRLAAFKSALDAGASEAEAALLAKESTVNFDRMGYLGPWVNVHTMFFNAGFEGSMNFIRAAAKSRRFQAFLGGVAMSGAVHYVMMRGLMGQGPDDEYEYAMIPAHRRHRTAIIPIGDTYFQMPVSYGLNVFWALGQEMMAMAMGDKEATESGYDLMVTALQTFNPLPSGPTFGQLLAPSALDPFVQAGENVTWYGGDISSPFLLERNLPDHLKTPDASRAAKEATQALFEVLGGDAMKPSPMDSVRDFTPDNFDHVMNSLFGSLGRDIWRTVGKVYKEAAAPVRPDKNPFAGSFIYKTPELPVQRNFYEIREQTGRVVEMLDEMQKTDPERYEQSIEKYELSYGFGQVFEEVHRDLSPVRRLMRAAQTEEERAEYATIITETQSEIIKEYEAAVREAVSGRKRPAVTLKQLQERAAATRAELRKQGYRAD